MVVKIILIFLMMYSLLQANVYESNCVSCHNELPVSIDKYFYRYLLKYSSQKKVKTAMIRYLKTPSKKKSVMAEAFISRFGVKKTTTLKYEDLKKAVDIYWDKYKVFGKLK